MEFVAEYGLFFLKVATFVIAAVVVIGFAAGASKDDDQARIDVKSLNDEIDKTKEALQAALLDENAYKAYKKDQKKEQKAKDKAAKKDAKNATNDVEKQPESRAYVLDFDGDMHAKGAKKLAKEISTVLGLATEHDEVVIRLESPGGVVHGYGYAASQLQRVRDKNIPLTICVDKVAASGGYMMACIGSKIVAAPFAMIGSIGVLAQVPNFHRLLKKNDIDFELHTAGEYKRTLTMFGENTDEGREKFDEELKDTHELFKGFVAQYRPQLDISDVATGEVWFGTQAKEKALIDSVGTSDQYLMDLANTKKVFAIRLGEKKTLQQKIGLAVEAGITSSIDRLVQSLWTDRFR